MIDGGLRAAARPTNGRQVAYRNEAVRYQPDEPQRAEPYAPNDPPRQHQQKRVEVASEAPTRTLSFGWVKLAALVLAICAVAALAWVFRPTTGSNAIASTIDTGKYQAVFLSNGQVYFGRLSIVDTDFMKLTNVYYLERQLDAGTTESNDDTNTQPTTGDNNFQLLKYSDVLYGSEDAMIISRDDIIRYENLRNDGVVAKAIANRS